MNTQITKYSALALGLALVTSPYVAAKAAHIDAAREAYTEGSFIANIDAAREAYYAKLKAKPWGQVAEKYIKQFAQEEEALWLEVDKALGDAPGTFKNGINQSTGWVIDWFLGVRGRSPNNEKTNQNEETTRQFVHSLFQECCFDPKYIEIQVTPRNRLSKGRLPEIAFNFFSEIDHLPEYMGAGLRVSDITNVASVDKIKVDVLQSIMHIMHCDGFARSHFILHACGDAPDSKELAAIKNEIATRERFLLHIDKRSDALVALLSPEYAVQHIENLRSLKNIIKNLRNLKDATLERYCMEELDASTVQFYDERIAFLETIYQEMLACQ